MLAFSGTLPATVLALRGFDALLIGAGRSVIAAVLAAVALVVARARLPQRRQLPGLILVAAGCGIGFGVLSAIALRQVSASHAAVVVGLLPVATAIAATLRGGERASRLFWASSLAGAAVVLAFALSEGAGSLQMGDALLLVALVIGAVGYAQGGALAREMPGWHVTSWGLLLALPVSLPLSLLSLHASPIHAGAVPLAGLLYVSIISVFLGFIPWYRGLASIGVARASQLQLAQPFLSVAWAVLFVGERPGPLTLVAAALVLVCVALSQLARFSRPAARAVSTRARGATSERARSELSA